MKKTLEYIKGAWDITWNLLDGKKGFIGASIIFISGGLLALEKIDEDMFKLLEAFGLAIAVFGIRHAIKKLK